MTVEALPFVNWLFWTALTAGTALVVGVTERLGGTTRGYRLFMAFVLVVLAALLVLSDLALPGDAVAAGTEGLRRPLSIGIGVLAVAYLVASLRQWPRWAIAVALGIGGLAALVTMAAAGGSQSPALFAVQLVVAAVALGSVFAAMLLGHWYLVTPKLSPLPLRRMMWVLLVALVAQGVAFGVALAVVGGEALAGDIGWLTWLRLAVGILLPIGAGILAILASRAPSLQASTGLLYIGLALVMAGSIAGSSLTYLTGVPV